MRTLPIPLVIAALALPATASAHKPACTRHRDVVRCLHHRPLPGIAPPPVHEPPRTVPTAMAPPEPEIEWLSEAQAEAIFNAMPPEPPVAEETAGPEVPPTCGDAGEC